MFQSSRCDLWTTEVRRFGGGHSDWMPVVDDQNNWKTHEALFRVPPRIGGKKAAEGNKPSARGADCFPLHTNTCIKLAMGAALEVQATRPVSVRLQFPLPQPLLHA